MTHRLRALFTAVPAFGHVLPLLPLARAARDAGAEAVLATAAAFAPLVAPLRVEPSGPDFPQLDEEFRRRGGTPDLTDTRADDFAEMFGFVRADLTLPALLRVAERVRPDLVVCDVLDAVGPIVAGALGVPWARALLGPDLPSEVTAAVRDAAGRRAALAEIDVPGPVAELDPWPDVLRAPGWVPRAGRIVTRPEPFRIEAHPRPTPTRGRPDSGRRHVLLTAGTIADDVGAVSAAVTALRRLDVEITLTGRHGELWPLDLDGPGAPVHQVGFVPLAELIADVDVAVVAGGSGTLTGVLSRGIATVVIPQVFDQFQNASLAGAAGAVLVAHTPDEMAASVRRAFDDPSVAEGARRAAAAIAAMDSPRRAWEHLCRVASS